MRTSGGHLKWHAKYANTVTWGHKEGKNEGKPEAVRMPELIPGGSTQSFFWFANLTITLMMRGVTAQCQWICSRPTWPLSSMASLELERVSKSMRITVDPYSGGDRSPTNFFRIGQNSEKYFLKIKTSTIKSAKNIYIKQYILFQIFINMKVYIYTTE